MMSTSNSKKLPLFEVLNNFLLGDELWAKLRALFLIISVGFIAVVIASAFEVVTLSHILHNVFFPLWLVGIAVSFGTLLLRNSLEVMPKDLKRIRYILGLIVLVVLPIWFEIKNFLPVLLDLSVFRYLIVPTVVLVGAVLAGVRYVQDVYNIKTYKMAFLYFISSFWGVGYPKIKISEGQINAGNTKENRLKLIGGPGYIFIRPGNAILTERLHSPAGVYSAGEFFVSRFESIVSTLNLDDQHGLVPSVSAVTKDGITVIVKDVQFRYRVWSGQRDTNTAAGRSLTNPYPFTVQAIRSMSYNRSVKADGLTSWHDTVKGVIVGSITDYITRHQLDQITAPRYVEGDPRKEISAQLKTPGTRDRLKDIGAQLLWCDIGHFEVENKAVSDQRIDTWKAGWMGNADVKRAYGEAQRVAYQEIGHAEAQAEILMSIVHAFDDIDLAKEEKDRNIRNIILMRTAQVLEALSATSGSEQSPEKDIKKDGKKP